MRILRSLRLRVRALWEEPDASLGPHTWSLEHCVLLVRVCARRMRESNVTAMSAALSFRTIFALVPLLVLTFLLLRTAGVLENSKQSLRRVLDASGVSQIVLASEGDAVSAGSSRPATDRPARVINVADEIERLVERVEEKLTIGRVGPVGFVLLVYTATTLLSSVEHALNRIFGAARSRSLLRQLPIYWSVLTLGPILLAAATYLGRQATGTLQHVTGLSWFLTGAGGWTALFLGYVLVLWALYKLLPNTEVRGRSALAGAAVATPIWLVAKWGFSLYVAKFVSTGNLYGTLGLVPLFLIWLNLSWLIVLFGAEMAYMIDNPERLPSLKQARDVALRPLDLLAAAVAVAKPYLAGRGPVSLRQIGDQLGMPDESVRVLLDKLDELGVICTVRGRPSALYVLARPAESIPVAEVLQMTHSDNLATAGCHPEIAATVAQFQQVAQSGLSSTTLASLIQTNS